MDYGNKDLKKINIKIPKSLTILKSNIETVLKKNESVIEKYLEDNIYISRLPPDIKEKLNNIFEDIRNNLIDNL